MADTTVATAVAGASDKTGLWGPYWISTTVGMIIFIDSASDPHYARTADGGATWTDEGALDAITCQRLSCWFDQETPGDSGTLVHCAYLDSTGGDRAKYMTIDVSDATLGTKRTVDSTVTVSASKGDHRIAITKARNGNLIIAFTTQDDLECYRSVDAGENWTDRADPFETATEEDWLLLFPANVDDGDVAGVFWDRSADAITVKMYDDSANSWTETAILSSMTDDTQHINMDGAVRHSDGVIVCCAHSNDDATGDDLRTFTVNPNSIASPTVVTTTANVFTNQGAAAQCCVLVNQQNDDVYIAYCKGGTWQVTTDIVYHISDDNMASWGVEQAYSEAAADDNRRVQAGRTIGDSGGFFQPVWFDDDDTDLYVNLVNDVAIAAVVADTGHVGWMGLTGVGI